MKRGQGFSPCPDTKNVKGERKAETESASRRLSGAKKGRGLPRRVVGRANNNANANGGCVYANANNASSNSNTNNGARLALKNIIGSMVCGYEIASDYGREVRASATANGDKMSPFGKRKHQRERPMIDK